VVELRPKTPTAQYQRLVFFVSGQNYQVLRTLVVDQAGNRNKMEFSNPHLNQGLPDSRFHFTPPGGTRIIRP
jgi:outer membrane lipoprotein-sorting protein